MARWRFNLLFPRLMRRCVVYLRPMVYPPPYIVALVAKFGQTKQQLVYINYGEPNTSVHKLGATKQARLDVEIYPRLLMGELEFHIDQSGGRTGGDRGELKGFVSHPIKIQLIVMYGAAISRAWYSCTHIST